MHQGLNQFSCAADDGEFVNLQAKHNFSLAHFGMLLGMLRTSLIDLQVQHLPASMACSCCRQCACCHLPGDYSCRRKALCSWQIHTNASGLLSTHYFERRSQYVSTNIS